MDKRRLQRRPQKCRIYKRLVETVAIPFIVSVLSQWLATYLSHWIH
jgi:hypothetical protein